VLGKPCLERLIGHRYKTPVPGSAGHVRVEAPSGLVLLRRGSDLRPRAARHLRCLRHVAVERAPPMLGYPRSLPDFDALQRGEARRPQPREFIDRYSLLRALLGARGERDERGGVSYRGDGGEFGFAA
jgi:hypothetical protein